MTTIQIERLTTGTEKLRISTVFWSQVLNTYVDEVVFRHQGDECLIWPFSLKTVGYALIRRNGRSEYVHRLACFFAHGEPHSPRHEAAHLCTNGQRGCVSPHHVRWATHAENMADKITQGTAIRGTQVGGSKLNEQLVLSIRALAGSQSKEGLARQFGVSRAAIRKILSGESWGWLS